MKVNGVNVSGYFEQINRNKRKENGSENFFSDNFCKPLSDREDEVKTSTGDAQNGCRVNYSAIKPGINISPVSEIEESSIIPCGVKNISYGECDNIKACIEDGCTYKAKVLEDKAIVYVERKNDDGTTEAFEVNINAVGAAPYNNETDNQIERIAAEAYENYNAGRKPSPEDDFRKGLLEFYGYVQERIENGPPKFMIGSTEMSIKDWDKMMEKIDALLDEIKEELRERVEEQETEEENSKDSEEAVKKLLQEGGV